MSTTNRCCDKCGALCGHDERCWKCGGLPPKQWEITPVNTTPPQPNPADALSLTSEQLAIAQKISDDGMKAMQKAAAQRIATHPALALADEALKRANAATPGPWIRMNGCESVFPEKDDEFDGLIICSNGSPETEEEENRGIKNMEFIAHARADVPTLAIAVRELVALDNPEFDGTDAAHPAWWRGHHQTTAMFCQHVQAILDKRDVKDESVPVEPWHTIRQRLIELVAQLSTAVPLEGVAGMVKAAYSDGFVDAFEQCGLDDCDYNSNWQHSDAREAVERLRGGA